MLVSAADIRKWQHSEGQGVVVAMANYARVLPGAKIVIDSAMNGIRLIQGRNLVAGHLGQYGLVFSTRAL